MNTFPPVAERCSSIRAGIGCSFPPGLCKRDNQPVENMSSGEEASTATGVAFEVDATGFDFASYSHSHSLVSSRRTRKKEGENCFYFFQSCLFLLLLLLRLLFTPKLVLVHFLYRRFQFEWCDPPQSIITLHLTQNSPNSGPTSLLDLFEGRGDVVLYASEEL